MKQNWSRIIKRFLIINFGLFIMTIGLHFFIIPANLATGGVTGLGMIIRAYIPSINLGLLMLVFNAILFVVAFLFIGKEFGGYTIYSSFALSGMIALFEWLIPMSQPVTDDIILQLAFGTLIPAVGMGIIFYQNASTGGTDIVAKVINKYTHIEIGKALFISDALITVLAGFTFSPRIGMYGFIGLVLFSIVIDKVIAGFETKVHVHIISNKNREIVDFVHNTLVRGLTLINGAGGFSGEPKQVISVVLSPRQYIRLKQFVRAVDPRAFLIMSYVHEVLGEGFDLASIPVGMVPADIAAAEAAQKA